MKPDVLVDEVPIDSSTVATAAERDHLALRSPSVPTNLDTLAALRGTALEVVEARVTVMETLRRASLRLTHPEDWVLFRARPEHGGQEVGYLEDAGAERLRDLWGIEIFDVSTPQKIVGSDPGSFHYLVQGSGRCKLTGQVLEAVEGGRSSSDDFVRGKSGVELELLVRKAARANLDGNVTRELAAMKSVPLEELRAAWAGTNKRVEQCRRGRGYGSADERVGGTRESEPSVPPPVCPHCGTTGRYRPAKGDRAAFYGCPNYEKHPDKKWIIHAATWVANQTKTPPTQPAKGQGSNGPSREPGQEG